MNRTVRTSLLVIGFAGLVVPALSASTRPLVSSLGGFNTPTYSFAIDGTQPMPPSVPLHPPTQSAWLDGTQPMPPSVPLHPPTKSARLDGTQPMPPSVPLHPPTM
jgi:hypothetical protein